MPFVTFYQSPCASFLFVFLGWNVGCVCISSSSLPCFLLQHLITVVYVIQHWKLLQQFIDRYLKTYTLGHLNDRNCHKNRTKIVLNRSYETKIYRPNEQ